MSSKLAGDVPRCFLDLFIYLFIFVIF